MNCYRMEEYNYDQGHLDVDATYILHLEGNGRLPQIQQQLEQYQPSRKVYLVYNKGYKKCSKQLHTDSPPIDLIDAFLTVFHDAKEKQYRNILVLEDDFQFHPYIKRRDIQEEINTFLHEHREKDIVYYLGCIPFLRMPGTHPKLFLSCGTHACIYTEKTRNRVLAEKVDTIADWDMYHNMNSTRYGYYTPLCYQLFPITENSKTWTKNFSNMGTLIQILLKVLHLDKQVEPGYTIAYIISLLFFFMLIYFLIKTLKIFIAF